MCEFDFFGGSGCSSKRVQEPEITNSRVIVTNSGCFVTNQANEITNITCCVTNLGGSVTNSVVSGHCTRQLFVVILSSGALRKLRAGGDPTTHEVGYESTSRKPEFLHAVANRAL